MKPPKDDQAQWNFGEVRDAEHREIIKGIEVVLGDAALAALLVVENFGNRQSEFGDHSPKVRIGVAEVRPDLFDDGAVVESEASEVFQDLNIGQAGDKR